MRMIFTVLVTFLVPAIAAAQPIATPAPDAWDVTAVAGFLVGRPDLPRRDRYQDDWYNTGQAGFIVGRHLTTHVKAELEFSASGEGRQYVQRFTTIRNLPAIPYSSERFTSLREVSALVTWQFFDNEWVHPFLQTGVGAAIERVRWHTWPQSIYVSDPRQPGSQVVIATERTEGPDTSTTPKLLVGGGAKFYASQKIFLRTDARVAFGDKASHTAFRIGLGVDF